jgi:hypothetical protein
VRLLRHLLDSGRYDVRVRPVRNNEHPVDVHVRMNLYQLIDVVNDMLITILYSPHSERTYTNGRDLRVDNSGVCVHVSCAVGVGLV